MDMWKILALSCVVAASARGSDGSTEKPFSSETPKESGPTQKLEEVEKNGARPLANDNDISALGDMTQITEQTEDSFESPQSPSRGIQSRKSSDDTPEGKLREYCQDFIQAPEATRARVWKTLVAQLSAFKGPLSAPTAEAVQEAVLIGLKGNPGDYGVCRALAVVFPDLVKNSSSQEEWEQALETSIKALRCRYAVAFRGVSMCAIDSVNRSMLLRDFVRTCGNDPEILGELLLDPHATEVQGAILQWLKLRQADLKQLSADEAALVAEAETVLTTAMSKNWRGDDLYQNLKEIYEKNAGY